MRNYKLELNITISLKYKELSNQYYHLTEDDIMRKSTESKNSEVLYMAKFFCQKVKEHNSNLRATITRVEKLNKFRHGFDDYEIIKRMKSKL